MLELDTLALDTLPGASISESIWLANMGSSAMTINSVVSDNPVFVAALANSTLEGEESTELTVTFSPDLGGLHVGHIVFVHNGPSSPDTLHVEGDGGSTTYIAGVVTNTENGNTLDSVMVNIAGVTTYTNANGEYGYYGAPAGLAGAQFEKEDFHNAIFNINLVEDDTVALNVALQPLDVNSLYSSGFETGQDSGSSEVSVGSNVFAVSNMFVLDSGDTVLPESGSSMLIFPDSGSYENNDMVFWVSDSNRSIFCKTG